MKHQIFFNHDEKVIGFVKLFIGELGTNLFMRILEGLDGTNGHDYIKNRLIHFSVTNSRIIVRKSLDTGILFALEYVLVDLKVRKLREKECITTKLVIYPSQSCKNGGYLGFSDIYDF